VVGKSLNGYWNSKKEENVEIYVEKVFKKGYVTGFHYRKVSDGVVHSPLKITHEELERDYTR
jgi:hypothetical protein